MSEFPKMLYRAGPIQGALALWPHDGVFYAVAQDADEQKAMMSEAGFVLTVEEAKNPKPKPTKRGRPRKVEDSADDNSD